jgi:hypothetical protein
MSLKPKKYFNHKILRNRVNKENSLNQKIENYEKNCFNYWYLSDFRRVKP